MANLPSNHPERYVLADEVHARPPEPLVTPSRASYLALLVDPDERERERAHLARLCARWDVAPPPAGLTQFSAQLGRIRLKWERHGEFSGYTLFANGAGERPFSEPVASLLPEGWLQGMSGQLVVAAHAHLMPADADGAPPDNDLLIECFEGNVPVGGEIGDAAGWAFTDFRIHDDGYSRLVLLDRQLTPRQAGRMLQRLFEIEAYRMLALLALPIARRQMPRIGAIESSLAELTDGIARGGGGGDDEALLHELTRLAAEIESGVSASQFRFGACRAYAELVHTRIAELRERGLPGTQTIEGFMARRFTPAVSTCATVSSRLLALSERIAQASALLSTRVDIVREKQNQAVLSSMDRRARLQLRLQQTVEGLSVAAIVYYVTGLIGYVSKGAKAAGLPLDPDLAVGLSVPVVAALAILALRRARRRLRQDEQRPTVF